MKSKFNRSLVTSITSVLALSSSAFAVDRFKADNLTNLNDAGSWDTLPTAADVAVFDSTFATAGSLSTGGLVSWSGVRIADPANNVLIPNATAGNEVTLGTSGIDMSAATRNLSIQRLRVDASQSWNVASGQSFNVSGTAVRTGVLTLDGAGPFAITKTGAGAVNLDTANVAIGNLNWDIQAGVVRAIWSGANAWGTGTITLGGGGIATGTPFGGSVGNWTWPNNIALTTATSSFIDNQNIAGTDRSLTLSGAITGGGSLSFNNTGTVPDPGFVFTLSGTNGYTGGTTVNGGTVVFGAAASVPATGVITVNANGAVGGAAFATVQDWLNSGKIAPASTGAVAISANSANAIDFSTGGYNNLALGSTGGFTYSGALTPGSGGYIFGGGKILTVTSALSAATTLTKNGRATTIISSDANAYSGATTVNSGELQALSTTTAGAKTTLGTAAITVNPGATLRFKTGGTTNAQSYANAINLNAATLISEDGMMTYGGAIDLTGANTISVVFGTKSATLSNTISGTGSFTKTGSGPLILTAAGNNIASLTVNQGKISIGATGDLTIVGQYRTSATSSKGSLDIAAGGVVNADSVFSSWGTDMLVNGALNVAGAFTFSGGTSTVTGSGTINTGTLAHTNYGTDNLNGARFNIGAGGITFNQPGALNLGATTLGAFADWSSSATMGLTAITTVNTLDSVDGTTPRAIALSGLLSGAAGGLTKTGAGTLTLSGANTYKGDTTVSGGVLAVNGTAIDDANKLVIDGGKVDPSGSSETVNTLFFGGVQQAMGTHGSQASAATFKSDTHFVIGSTGVIDVTTGPVGGYSTWASTNASGQTKDQDHDNDGVDNGIEYFMGLSGSGFTASPAFISGTVTWTKGGSYTGTYGTDFLVQTSTDLVTWVLVPVGTDPLLGTVTNNAGSVSYTPPVGQTKRFGRLVVNN